MINMKWCAIAFLVLLAGWTAFAQEGEEKVEGWNFLEDQLSIAADFETPHTKWGKPLAGGPIRALFFTSWAQGSTDPREIVELIQRFDIEGHAAYLMGDRIVGDGRPDWYGGDPEAGSNRVKALLQADPAVIVLNKIALESLPSWLGNAIARVVESGAGLLIIGAEAPTVSDVSPLPDPPGGLPAGSYASWGGGRVAILPAREPLVYQLGWETTFDYQVEAQGRALLWAANRAPAARLTVAVSDNPQQAAIAWTNAPSGTTLDLRVTRWDGVSQPIDHTLSESGGTVMLPRLREGAYHLDCFLRANGAVVAWTTAPFSVTADRRIDSVSLDRNWAEATESVAVRVAVSGAPAADDTMDVRLSDVHNRILTRISRKAIDQSPISVEIPAWAPALLRVEAVLWNGDQEISYGYSYLTVTTRNQDQFNFVMWNAASGDLMAYGVESLAKHGVTAVLQGGPPHLSLAANGLAYVPYAASFRASSHTTTAMLDPNTGVLKTGCVHDPEAMRKTVGQTVEGVMKAREQGVFVYSLGDENAVRASCLSPHCLEAYRTYLADMYGSIAALNAEWDSNYSAFAEIDLLRESDLPAANAPEWFKQYFAERQTLHRTDNEGAEGEALDRQIAFGDINDEMRALQAGNFARWYDRQAFQNQTYIEWCKQFQDAFLQIDPKALTGFEGTDSFTIRKLTTRSRQGLSSYCKCNE